MEEVQSKTGVRIRLPDERWQHITQGHPELVGMQAKVLDTVANPEYILEGNSGELLAVGTMTRGKRIVIVYREANADGFVITAFITSKTEALFRRKQIWPS